LSSYYPNGDSRNLGPPFAATLLIAAGAGATARTVTTGAIEGKSYGIEDLATDASIGAVDDLATVTGMKAGTAVAQNVLRSTATNTLRQEGFQVTERTVAHMSQELLSGSTRARVAFGALEGTVDGALGGALGEGGTTAFSDGTWDQGFTAGLQRMGVNTALGGGFGAFGGALGGGVFGRKSTHLADDLVDALPLAKTGGRGGINEGEFARSGISLKQAENMRQELLAQADTARVQDSLRSLGVTADREMIETVKQYNFDSPGIVFDTKNHDAWSRLASGQGTPQDAAYFVHEMAEINALKDQGVDALGRNFATMTESQQKQWKSSFDQSYDVAHQQGVKAERGFLSQNNAIEQDMSQTGSAKGVGSASIDGVSASALPANRIGSEKISVSKIEENVRNRISSLTSTEFKLTYSSDEIKSIVQSGENLGLDSKSIEDLLFTGSRVKKSISPNELVRQMDNYVNIVSKRGFPYKFNSAKDFVSFTIDLKGLLAKSGLPVDDIRIQGSSLRTPDAKDVDIAVFVSEGQFNELSQGMIEGIQRRANPYAASSIIGSLESQISDGRINSFYFDRASKVTFNQQLNELTRYMTNNEGVDLSLILKGRNFDVSPYLGL
jgi:hypothetical protein